MIQDGRSPLLVQKRDAWENFTLENRGNNQYAIKSIQNTYLTLDGGKLVWKNQPWNGAEVWNFQVLSSAPQGFNQGFSSQGTQGQGYVDGKMHGHLANWLSNLGKNHQNQGNQGNFNFNPFPANNELVALKKNGQFAGVHRDVGQ